MDRTIGEYVAEYTNASSTHWMQGMTYVGAERDDQATEGFQTD
jgi:hypothetical protein